MALYEFQTAAPEAVRDFFLALTNLAEVKFDPPTGRIVLRMEAADLWEVAQSARQLNMDADSILGHGWSLVLEKPTEVQETE